MTALRNARFVGQLMTSDPVLATVDMPLPEAAALMDFFGVSGLPVIDWSGALVGVLSQSDLIRVRATESLWARWSALQVRNAMTTPARSVTRDARIGYAARMMEELGIHRLVVTDDDGETPIGVLSVTDLVHAMADRPES